MWKLPGLVVIAATALLLSNLAESKPALRGAKFAQFAPRGSEVGASLRQPRQSARAPHARQRSRPGNLAWRNGHWRHIAHSGRFGWWWVVGGVWYYYPELIDGPPDYVSDIVVEDERVSSSPPPT